MMQIFTQRTLWLAVGAQLTRLILLLLMIGLTGIALAAAAITIQAQRDETRSTDMLVVIAPNLPPSSLIEHSFDLYRRGYAAKVALAGPGRERARADLLGFGVPPSALTSLTDGESLSTALAVAQRSGVRSLLVVSEPASQLLNLKIAHDQGIKAYGTPDPEMSLEAIDALRAAMSYWSYALFNL